MSKPDMYPPHPQLALSALLPPPCPNPYAAPWLVVFFFPQMLSGNIVFGLIPFKEQSPRTSPSEGYSNSLGVEKALKGACGLLLRIVP